MTSQSRRQIGWVWPFVALLTIGLPKPDRIISNESNSTSSVKDDSPAAIVVPEPVRRRKPINFEKAREFRLSARLSVTAQLNRPKPIDVKKRKVNLVSAYDIRRQCIPQTTDTARPSGITASIIAFPAQGSSKTQLPQAA